MKKLLLVLLLVGCAGAHVSTSGALTPVCRHQALYIASVVGEYYPVKIAYGESKEKQYPLYTMRFAAPWNNTMLFNNATVTHVQAKAFIGGKWQWLGLVNGQIVITGQDRFDPKFDYTIEQFFHAHIVDQIE